MSQKDGVFTSHDSRFSLPFELIHEAIAGEAKAVHLISLQRPEFQLRVRDGKELSKMVLDQVRLLLVTYAHCFCHILLAFDPGLNTPSLESGKASTFLVWC